jgi:hypothetical protein
MIPSPSPALLAEAARLRRRLAVDGPLGGAPIGTVPIRWNDVDGPKIRPAASAATILDDLARAGYDGCQLGSSFPTGEELRSALR